MESSKARNVEDADSDNEGEALLAAFGDANEGST